jgi:uncharacterized protein (DUF736 family)
MYARQSLDWRILFHVSNFSFAFKGELNIELIDVHARLAKQGLSSQKAPTLRLTETTLQLGLAWLCYCLDGQVNLQ